MNCFDVSIADKSYDGILCLKFTHKFSNYCFILMSCYLPPSNSVWGRDGVSFYNHLMSLVYNFSNADAIYIAGDLNSRFGDVIETIDLIDCQLPERKILDQGKNKHGETFLDFLRDGQLCIVNGRINPDFDNFTFIDPSRGSSVVDFVVVPFINLADVKSFKVLSPADLTQLVSNVDRCTSDHSLLVFEISPHFNVVPVQMTNASGSDIPNQTDHDGNATQAVINRYAKKYDLKDLNDQFLQSDEAQAAIQLCIQNIQRQTNEQREVDKNYDQLCKVFYNEMDKTLKSRNPCSRAKRRLRRCKPFWTNELTNLRQAVCSSEKIYLRAPQNSAIRRHYRKRFYDAQNLFDKTYKKIKRQYQEGKIKAIESLNTENPKYFWQEIRNLGPRKSSSIPCAVYGEAGSIDYNEKNVFEKWKNDFSTLYNTEPLPGTFDDDFYTWVMTEKLQLEQTSVQNQYLNRDISEDEVRKALNKAKSGKAVGIDNIPNEVMKNSPTILLLKTLFGSIFKSTLIPSLWKKAIIKPIPKNASIDPKVPMQYRAISLLSTVYKIYTSILNSRLLTYAERNVIHDEQNGFRPGRSCNDHIYTLSTVLRHRILQKKSTFVSFIDAEKAFDRVDRSLLMYKLLKSGVNGKFYEGLITMYSGCLSAVSINGKLTDWFNIGYGVRQGDTLSPTLFNIFINDLIDDVNSLNLGVSIGNRKLSILLYADDVVLLADTESELQAILNKVSEWGKKWRIKFNNSKSKIVHYRPRSVPLTTFEFLLSGCVTETVSKYKYLGAIFDQHLDYKVTAETLAGAGGRALGAILAKYKNLNGLGYSTFTKLYNACVCPILDYASGIWGAKEFDKIDHVQNRAIRAFLGVHNFAPNLGIQGDMGWTSSSVRRKVNIVRVWNNLVNMNSNRLAKKVFQWDLEQQTKAWAADVKVLFSNLNMADVFQNRLPCPTEQIWALLHEAKCCEWKRSLTNYPKLRTYVKFKENFCIEPYTSINMNRKYRSILAQLRIGILPLEIETGRWKGVEIERRTCQLCNSGSVEDESHFLFECIFYACERNDFFTKIGVLSPESLSTETKFKKIMEHCNILNTVKYACEIYEKRKSKLFG